MKKIVSLSEASLRAQSKDPTRSIKTKCGNHKGRAEGPPVAERFFKKEGKLKTGRVCNLLHTIFLIS